MYVESYHCILKIVCFDHKPNKQEYDLLIALLKMDGNKIIDLFKKMKNTKAGFLRDEHKRKVTILKMAEKEGMEVIILLLGRVEERNILEQLVIDFHRREDISQVLLGKKGVRSVVNEDGMQVKMVKRIMSNT